MALPIRQNLDVLAGLNRTQRAVLTLVVELAENGGKGYCDATNAYLCQRTQATARTVTRTLAELQRLSLLASGGHTTRRQITATDTLRPCYASASKEACFAATIALGDALSIDKLAIDAPGMAIDIPCAAIAIPGQCLETNGALAIDIPCAPYKETSKDEYLDEKDEQSKELALAQKKIVALVGELTEAEQSLTACRATITDLRAELENENKKNKGGATHVPTSLSRLPFPTEAFAAAWDDFRLMQGIAANSARERVLFKDLQSLATTESEGLAIVTQSIRKNWKSFFKLDQPQRHANPTNGTQPNSRYQTTRHANGFGSFAVRPPGDVARQPTGGTNPVVGPHPLPGAAR